MSVLEWPTGLTVYKPEKCCNGYTVYSPHLSPYVYMIDMNGEVVHMWAVNMQKDDDNQGTTIGTTWYHKYLPKGNLLVFVNRFGVKELDWDSRVVWEYRDKNAHHDFVRLDNGNTMILTRELGISEPRISDKPVYDDRFIEVTPTGDIVWEWRSIDHYDDFEFTPEAKRLIRERGLRNGGVDWLHTNTLEVLPNGNISTCFREVGMIAIVDKNTGRFLWKYDNLVGPHHPNMIENGNIIVYDNGGQSGYPLRWRNYTRLLEINPQTNETVWEYSYLPQNWERTHFSSLQGRHRSQFFSTAWGSIQRLPNGNTFSLDATGGRLFEITAEGEIVWEYVNPYLSFSFEPYAAGSSVNRGVYRCYRIAYEDAPKASTHGTSGKALYRPGYRV